MNLSQLLSPHFSAAHDTPPSSSPMFTAGVKFRRMATTFFAGSRTDEEDDHVTTKTSDMPDLVTETFVNGPLFYHQQGSFHGDEGFKRFLPHVDTVKNEPDEEMEAHYR